MIRRIYPRFEVVINLCMELIVTFLCLLVFTTAFEESVVHQLGFYSIDPVVDRIIIQFVSMFGAVGVLICSTYLTIAEKK